MLVLVVVGLLTLAGIGLTTAAQEAALLQVQSAERLRTQVSGEIIKAIADFRDRKGFYPETLTALADENDFRHTRLIDNNVGSSLGYQRTSGTVVDVDWQKGSRVVLYTVKPGAIRELQKVVILSGTNSCGNGSFKEAKSWCPPRGSTLYYATLESRGTVSREIAAQRKRMVRTLHRLANFQQHYGTFPRYGFNGTDMSTGTDYVLATVASNESTKPTAANCSQTALGLVDMQQNGTIKKAMPLGCEDLFDIWGGHISYRREKAQKVQIFANTPYSNASGTQVVIAMELEL